MKKFKASSRSVTRKRITRCGDEIITTTYYHKKKRLKPSKFFVFRWSTGNQSYVEGFMARITNEEQVSVVVAPKTPGNHPAKIDGNVTFLSSDETVAKVASTGQFGAVVTGVSAGAAVITASFDADIGEGVSTITLTGAIEVVDAQAVTGVLEFGTPELQPPAPAA